MRRLLGIKGIMVIVLTVVIISIVIASGVFGIGFKSEAAGDEAITFSRDSGSYNSEFSLTITSASGTTIYYTTDGSVPVPGNSKTKKYTGTIQVTDLKGSTPVLTTSENAGKFVNSGSANVPWNINDLDRAYIVRAVAVDSAGTVTPVSTRTYFVGNDIVNSYNGCAVMSIVTDPDNLLNNDTGIYVTGTAFANDNNTDSDERVKSANFMQKGREWERSAYMEFFDGTGTPAVSTGVGIRIHGGYSRRNQQKSMNIYFRDDYDYGTKNLKGYDLIPGATKTYYDTTDTTDTGATMNFSDIMIRNGGNDVDITKFQDIFIQSMVEDKKFTTQSSKPCMVYLNGEYWGLYNLTEKYSDKYLKEEFNVDNNNVIMYKNLEIDEGEELDPDGTALNELMSLGELDMTQEANYKKFQDMVDIDSFIDYYATEIYINNNDWWSGCNNKTPNNNVQFWKVADPSLENVSNPYADGKWRYMLFDTEWSMGLYGSTQAGANYDSIKYHAIGEPDPNNNNDINQTEANGDPVFAALFKNNDFQKRFTNTLLDIRNWNFEYNRCVSKLDKLSEEYTSLIEKNRVRWNSGNINERVNSLKEFLSQRPDYVLTMLENNIDALSSDARVNVSVSANVGGSSLVKVNSVTPDISEGWTGKYYKTYPINVRANETAGHSFSHWEVSGGNATDVYSAETDITLTAANANIVAVYSEGSNPEQGTTTVTNDGYIVEYSIPFTNDKKAGDMVGFEVQVNDCTTEKRYGTLNMFADSSPYDSGEQFGKVTLSDTVSSLVSGKGMQAIMTDKVITIDGLIDDTWSRAVPVTLAKYQPINDGTQNCNAKAKVMWDSKNLYVLVVVEDKDLVINTNTYESDSVEVFYDEDAANPVDYSSDMFQYRTLYNGTSEFGKQGTNPLSYNVKSAARLIGYTVEYAVPFKSVKQAGNKASFEIQVNDSVSSVTTNRIGKLNLFAVSSAFSDRTQFGLATLCDSYPAGGVMAGTNNIYAVKAVNAIKVDGSVDSEWMRAEPVLLEKYTVYKDKTTGEPLDIAQQINAQARVMWDNNYFYVLVTVVDTDRNKIGDGDAVELFYDENAEETSWTSEGCTAFQYRTYYDGISEEGQNYSIAQYAVLGAAASTGKIVTELPSVPTASPAPTATANPTALPDEAGHKATFGVDSHATITTYKTQDYTLADGRSEKQTSAYARNSDTGDIDITGDGQVNFTIVPDKDYEVESVVVSPVSYYKNCKGPDETGLNNTYRVTKINGDITITVVMKYSGQSTTPPNNTQPPTSYPTVKPTATVTGKPIENPTASPDVEATEAPDDKPTPEPDGEATEAPDDKPTPEPHKEATNAPFTAPPVTATPISKDGVHINNNSGAEDKIPQVGDEVTVGKNVFAISVIGQVEFYSGTDKSLTGIEIPATVSIKGKTYKVTSIAANAFKNCRKLKKIIIGKNIKSIGKNAFYGCSKLKKITVKSKIIKMVGKKAFYKIHKKAVYTFPVSKYKTYINKIFYNKGQADTVKYNKK